MIHPAPARHPVRLILLMLAGIIVFTSCAPHRLSGSAQPPLPSTAASTSRTACTFRQLGVTVTGSTGALGLARAVIVFGNISHSTCGLIGYPSITEAGGPHATDIAAAQVPAGYPPAWVSLAPGAQASSAVTTTSLDPGCAAEVTGRVSLLASLPGESHRWRLTLATPICRPLAVHPIVAGADGRLVD